MIYICYCQTLKKCLHVKVIIIILIVVIFRVLKNYNLIIENWEVQTKISEDTICSIISPDTPTRRDEDRQEAVVAKGEGQSKFTPELQKLT